jgi:hypothetical protein
VQLWNDVFRAAVGQELHRAGMLAIRALEQNNLHLELPMPSAPLLLRLVLELHRAQLSDFARQVQEQIKRWMEHAGSELSFVTPELRDRWILTEQLSQLPGKFPGPVRTTLATAVLGGDMEQTRKDLRAFLALQPSSAEVAIFLLVEHAPLLHSIFTPLFHGPEQLQISEPPAAPERGRSSGGGGLWRYAVLVIALVNLVRFWGSGSSSSDISHASTAATLPAAWVKVETQVAERSAMQLCRSGETASQSVCGLAQELAFAISARNCIGASGVVLRLRDEKAKATTAGYGAQEYWNMSSQVDELTRAFQKACAAGDRR